MSKPKVAPDIREEDYEAFSRMSPDLPDTFEEWVTNAADIDRRLKARGVSVDRIVIRPDEFAVWARRRNMGFDEVARRAFAVSKDRRG
jgi:hypothetical protein